MLVCMQCWFVFAILACLQCWFVCNVGLLQCWFVCNVGLQPMPVLTWMFARRFLALLSSSLKTLRWFWSRSSKFYDFYCRYSFNIKNLYLSLPCIVYSLLCSSQNMTFLNRSGKCKKLWSNWADIEGLKCFVFITNGALQLRLDYNHAPFSHTHLHTHLHLYCMPTRLTVQTPQYPKPSLHGRM